MLLNNRDSTKKIAWACDWYLLKAHIFLFQKCYFPKSCCSGFLRKNNFDYFLSRRFQLQNPIGGGYLISTLVLNRWRIVIAGVLCRLADWQPRLKLILRNIHSSYNPNDNDILFKVIIAKYKH